MQASSILYVIGNGFDLHHGLATGFSDFKQYVMAEQPDIKDKMEEYLSGLEENWCNLEEALAYFDVDTLIDQANDFLVGYGADDWSDSYHHDYQYEIEQVVRAVSVGLKDQFYSWLSQIEIPNSKKNFAFAVDGQSCWQIFKLQLHADTAGVVRRQAIGNSPHPRCIVRRRRRCDFGAWVGIGRPPQT